jgi:dsDNA-specific endonuclease/ATPase MutS2
MGWWQRFVGLLGTPRPTPDELPDDPDDDAPFEVPDAVAVAITDELDLHPFQPREVGSLVAEYLDEAQRLGFTRVRLVHGKGVGHLRRTVHATLDRHPAVSGYRLADERAGSWGATLVDLRPRSRNSAGIDPTSG